jgi:hypothetical protein
MKRKHFVITTIKLFGFIELRNVTKFSWLDDAVRFAVKTNGILLTPIYNP